MSSSRRPWAAIVLSSAVAGTGMFSATAAAEGETVLVRDGVAQAAIVLDQQPTKAAQFAAFELQWHVARITGAMLPILREGKDAPAGQLKVHVGASPRVTELGFPPAGFKLQEYVIHFAPDAVVLAGRDKDDRGEVKYDYAADPTAVQTWPSFWDEQGTMYAVYDFLERFCNVRWFDHTETGAVIPEAKTLAVKGTDVRRAPAFRFRYASYYNSGAYDAYVALWPQGSEGFKRWEAAAYADAHQSKSYSTAKYACAQLFRYRRREGGEMSACNHSLYGYYGRFWDKNNPAFVAQHKEWFAQGYPDGTPPQLCYTNPGLIEQVAQDAQDYFKGEDKKIGLNKFQWGENFFAVEPMDNSSFCKCAKCQELVQRKHSQADNDCYSQGTHSDYFFYFVNEVAKRVKKSNPDKWVVTLAYMTHAYPPESFKLESNVAVQFCFASNRSPQSGAQYENDLRALKAWSAQGQERPLYLWLYYTFPVESANNGKYHCFPGFFAHTIGEQFKLFSQYGYRGMFHCGYGQEVESYVTYKLMDDPTLNVDTLLDEYFGRLFGAAGAPMKKLYLGIEKAYCDPANYPKDPGHSGPEVAWKYVGSETRMAEFAQLMEQAKALAATDIEKRRVALFELGTWSYMAEGRKRYTDRLTAPIPAVKVPRGSDAGGDPAKVDWTKAAELGGIWFDRGQSQPAARRLSGRALHDGKWFYIELTDPCDTKKLVSTPTVFCYDDWELFFAAQRAHPCRQFAVNPSGSIVALTHGEVNWRMNVEFPDHGVKVVPDTSAPDKWVTRLALPLANLVKGGAAPGGKVYLNILRVSGPALTTGGHVGIDTWVSFCTVHETDRLAELTLE